MEICGTHPTAGNAHLSKGSTMSLTLQCVSCVCTPSAIFVLGSSCRRPQTFFSRVSSSPLPLVERSQRLVRSHSFQPSAVRAPERKWSSTLKLCQNGSVFFPIFAGGTFASAKGDDSGYVSEEGRSALNLQERLDPHNPQWQRRLVLGAIAGITILNVGTAFADEEENVVSKVSEKEEGPPPTTPTELIKDPPAAAPTGLVQKLLERSKANKVKNDKERLDSYYRRNYKEYFEYIKGTIRNKTKEELTEAEAGILQWLEKNK